MCVYVCLFRLPKTMKPMRREGNQRKKPEKKVSETRKLRWRRQFESTPPPPSPPLLISTGTDCPKVGKQINETITKKRTKSYDIRC